MPANASTVWQRCRPCILGGNGRTRNDPTFHEDRMAAGLTDGTGVPTPVGFGVTGEELYATAPWSRLVE